MRIALVVEYDGSQYHGWQAQTGLHTIQQAVEFALSKVADSSISVVCAGRTDTGVHATNQVIHFDCEKDRSIRAWIHGANTFYLRHLRQMGQGNARKFSCSLFCCESAVSLCHL